VTIQDPVDGHTQVGGGVFISHDLEQDGLQLSRVVVVGDSTTAGLSSTLKSPWLRARLDSTTADHALGFTGSESAGDTTNGDASGKVIKGNEGGQRPIGAAAEKRGTNLRAHDECYSSGLVEGKPSVGKFYGTKGDG
jgi:hypothetical protein